MNDNRHKLTGILKLLYENTDESHSMDTYQIMDALESMGYGRPDRKTIDANIKFIVQDLKFGIEKEKGKPNKYRWTTREFDLSELKLITDAVNSASFIGRTQSRAIITKLKDLTSVYKASLLNRDIFINNRGKRDERILTSNLDMINEAISSSLRLTFGMITYDLKKNEIYADGEQMIEASPYAVVINDGCYYMLAMVTGDDSVSHFRVDSMRDVKISDSEAIPSPSDFTTDGYASRVFDMFNGELTKVELDCRKSAMSEMIDRFGRDFFTAMINEERFLARVTVDISPSFLAWVFKQGGSVRITSPQWVCDRYSDMLRRQMY